MTWKNILLIFIYISQVYRECNFNITVTVAIICTFLIRKQIKALLFPMFLLSTESLLVTYCAKTECLKTNKHPYTNQLHMLANFTLTHVDHLLNLSISLHLAGPYKVVTKC